MDLSIRRLTASDGERLAILVDGSGMPLYYPNLFATWHLRSRSLAASSIFNALNAVKAVYAWQVSRGIDLESQFSRSELLDEDRIRDLCDFLQQALRQSGKQKVVSIRRRPQTVAMSSLHFRVTMAASYLGFLSDRLRPSGQGGKEAATMVARIRANRPGKPNRISTDRDERYLDEAVIDFIAEALKPGSDANPSRDHAVQIRNILMFSLLRVTGMRRGELLNIKVEDLDFGEGLLRVVRRPDSKGDARSHQPTVKTLQRKIPIVQDLMDRIHDYVLHHRNKLPGAKKHGYLFVTHKAGPTQGHPFSIPAFQKWIANVASIVEGSGLHAHALRHHWNFSFSTLSDSKGITPEKEEQIRSYLMGWSATSGTAATYNKRHIKQRAAEAALGLQEQALGRRLQKGDL